jgi:quinol monooxygenase YgiN
MAMGKVSMIGTLTCQDGRADDMATVLASMVEAARDEPGVEIYSYHRGEGNTFWFFALMADEAATQNHGQSEAMQAAMQAFGPLMAEPPQMSVATPVAALGFDV